MTFHHWSLTKWFQILCSTKIKLFTHWDSCSTLDSICPHWWFPHLCRQYSLLVVIQRVSFMCYLHLVHTGDILHGGPYNISSESFQIFGLLLLFVLDDGGCLNSLLPTDLFLSNSTHISLGHGSRVIFSTLGLTVISGRFPLY
jgi:hypothetical protein